MGVRILTLIGVCIAASACVTKPPPLTMAQAERVQARTSPKRALPPLKQVEGRAYTADWHAWEYWECVVKWNQYCDIQEGLEANPEWDACKPFWGAISAGKGGPLWAVGLNDHNEARYRMYVKGSWKVYDQWGSHLRVEDVGLKLIERGASAAERKAAGCVEGGWHNRVQRIPRTKKPKWFP